MGRAMNRAAACYPKTELSASSKGMLARLRHRAAEDKTHAGVRQNQTSGQ